MKRATFTIKARSNKTAILNEYNSVETRKKGMQFRQPVGVILQFYRLVLSGQLLRYKKGVRRVNRVKRGRRNGWAKERRRTRNWKRHARSKMVASEKQLFGLNAAVFPRPFSYTDLIYSRSIVCMERVIESRLLLADQKFEI